MTQYAFTFDARFCTGCKACQAACKDKNNLPTGVLWRRVIEVNGGSWQQSGEAWTNSVFAYNLSIACNHCVHPKCAGICPTNAYIVRDDGIVLLDETKCTGCGYCAWACPYGAPQYNPVAGHTTKCNLCFDQIDQGLPPTCVAACPMRVLDYREISSSPLSRSELQLWDVAPGSHPYPLPNYSHTQPRLAIKPHAAMGRSEEKSVANREEIQSTAPSGREDLPLVLFTLLVQTAVGSYWAMTWMADTFSSLLVPSLVIGMLLASGMLASLAHLGRKTRALNMLRNLRRSSLSREVFFAGLFGLGWLSTTCLSIIWQRSVFEAMAITSILGIGLIYNMSQVYRFPAAPGWNTWRTNAAFMVSTLLLGLSAMTAVLARSARVHGMLPAPDPWLIGSLFLLLISQLLLTKKPSTPSPLYRVRTGILLAGIVSVSSFLIPGTASLGVSVLVLLIVFTEEAMGRWLFYQSRI